MLPGHAEPQLGRRLDGSDASGQTLEHRLDQRPRRRDVRRHPLAAADAPRAAAAGRSASARCRRPRAARASAAIGTRSISGDGACPLAGDPRRRSTRPRSSRSPGLAHRLQLGERRRRPRGHDRRVRDQIERRPQRIIELREADERRLPRARSAAPRRHRPRGSRAVTPARRTGPPRPGRAMAPSRRAPAAGRRARPATSIEPLSQRGSADSIPTQLEAAVRGTPLTERRVQPPLVEEGAGSASRPPLLAGAEVVDVAELDVGHRLPGGDSDRQGVVRESALGVQRAVDRVDHDQHVAAAEVDVAALLGDRVKAVARRRRAAAARRRRSSRPRRRSPACGRRRCPVVPVSTARSAVVARSASIVRIASAARRHAVSQSARVVRRFSSSITSLCCQTTCPRLL